MKHNKIIKNKFSEELVAKTDQANQSQNVFILGLYIFTPNLQWSLSRIHTYVIKEVGKTRGQGGRGGGRFS